MLVIRAAIHKMLVRIVNSHSPDQTASEDLGLHCLSRPFSQGACDQNFRAPTVVLVQIEQVIQRSKVAQWKSARLEIEG